MMDFPTMAPIIRMFCYAVLAMFLMFRAAYSWHREQVSVSAIHLLAGLFMLSSFYFAWTRDSMVGIWFTTPLLLLLTSCTIYYAVRWFR